MSEPKQIVLYKYYPPERVDNLERKRIYFCHVSVFNDPFETVPYFSPSLSARLQSAFAPHGIVSPAQIDRQFETGEPLTMVVPRNKADLQAAVDDVVGQHNQAVAVFKRNLVFSVSQDGENLLMWAHYADKHTGFAVGFRAAHEKFFRRLDGHHRNLTRVNYTYLRPPITSVDEITEQDLLLTKSWHWMHEKEWRMFESAFNADDNEPIVTNVWGFRLEPETVERVILGYRIAADTRASIMQVLDRPEFRHVHLLQATLDPNEFEIRHKLIREGRHPA